jgi:hypothetical protein
MAELSPEFFLQGLDGRDTRPDIDIELFSLLLHACLVTTLVGCESLNFLNENFAVVLHFLQKRLALFQFLFKLLF